MQKVLKSLIFGLLLRQMNAKVIFRKSSLTYLWIAIVTCNNLGVFFANDLNAHYDIHKNVAKISHTLNANEN